jgi:hypothetical protein
MSKAYIVAVDMGYGHQRAVFPLEYLAELPEGWKDLASPIISANNYPGIPKRDRKRWENTRKVYEWISKMRSVPYIGILIFSIMDYFQRVPVFYPKRDLSGPSLQVYQIYSMIKGGLGKHLIDTLNEKPLPFLTSFFMTAFFAEEHGYKGEIYCLCTDTDISRAWAPLHPEKSRIIYLAPNHRVKERLLLYGIREEKIITTGFPLPKDALGDEDSLSFAKESAYRRIVKLDPSGTYRQKYQTIISECFDVNNKIESKPVNLTFAIGGAGAQAEIGAKILISLKDIIANGEIKLNLIVGTSKVLFDKYSEIILEKESLRESSEKGFIKIIYNSDKFSYFREFTKTIIETDVLWTKPSELSFYAGLGLPILIAPTLGSQEDRNKEWLHSIKAGIDQGDPEFANQWFMDWLNEGKFAELVTNGFLNAPKRGTYHIESLLLKGEKEEIENIHRL